jgi:hypothetical protein
MMSCHPYVIRPQTNSILNPFHGHSLVFATAPSSHPVSTPHPQALHLLGSQPGTLLQLFTCLSSSHLSCAASMLFPRVF